jgi:acetyltransferase
MEQKWIKEIDINPLIASGEGLLALDARVVLHGSDVVEPPKPAIRPYPVQYVKPWRFEDGTEVTIRPIRPEDESLIVAFHSKLSDRTVAQRYAEAMPLDARVAHERLVRICFGDYDREIALVAERWNAAAKEAEILSVGRLSKAHLVNEAELTVLTVDEYQGRGLGSEISRRLLEIARKEKLDRVTVEIAGENPQMLEVCRGLGFEMGRAEDGVVRGVFVL